LTEHPFINNIEEKLTPLDVERYYKDLESNKNYKPLIPEAVPSDPNQLLFSTKGKDNWNPLFTQLI
jgi:hypothetical protein